MFDPGIGLQHVKAGKLKLLAVGSPKRSPQFPDVPTLDEAGLKNFDADTWFGFYAPAGTPPAVVSRLNTEINKILRSPAFIERMNAIGAIPAPMSRAGLRRARADRQRPLRRADPRAQHQGRLSSTAWPRKSSTPRGSSSATATRRASSGFPTSSAGSTTPRATSSSSAACRPGTRRKRRMGVIGTPLVDSHSRFLKTATYGDELQLRRSASPSGAARASCSATAACAARTLIMECDEVRIFAGRREGDPEASGRCRFPADPRALRMRQLSEPSDGASAYRRPGVLAHPRPRRHQPTPGVLDRKRTPSQCGAGTGLPALTHTSGPADCAERNPSPVARSRRRMRTLA